MRSGRETNIFKAVVVFACTAMLVPASHDAESRSILTFSYTGEMLVNASEAVTIVDRVKMRGATAFAFVRYGGCRAGIGRETEFRVLAIPPKLNLRPGDRLVHLGSRIHRVSGQELAKVC